MNVWENAQIQMEIPKLLEKYLMPYVSIPKNTQFKRGTHHQKYRRTHFRLLFFSLPLFPSLFFSSPLFLSLSPYPQERLHIGSFDHPSSLVLGFDHLCVFLLLLYFQTPKLYPRL